MVEDRIKFQTYLKTAGIASDPVHVRNDNYSIFKKFKKSPSDLPGVEYFCNRHINIPVGWWLTDENLKYIVDTINDYK